MNSNNTGAPFTYDRLSGDRIAEVYTDQAALGGQWANFMEGATEHNLSQLHEIPADAAASMVARNQEDRSNLEDNLYRRGFPFGIVKEMVDENLPIVTEDNLLSKNIK